MTTRTVCRLALALLLAGAPPPVSARQSRRAPTADESKVLTRFYAALSSIVGRFADTDWQVRGGTLPDEPGHESISVHAGVPLDDCLGGDRTWTVREGSPRFRTTLLPLYERAQALAGTIAPKMRAGQATAADMAQMERLHQQIKSLSEVTLDVCANSPNIAAAALAPDAPSILAGVVAHKAPAAVCGGDPVCYVLVYGDWKSARRSGDRYDFHFVHPAASPYLENIVVRLHGADDRIREMLASDWARLTAALGGPTT